MNDREFSELVDAEFMRIEDQLDELTLDIDIDSSGGVLTLTMEDGSQVILSRQPASHEIWVAARAGGFHLSRRDDRWYCGTTDEDLDSLLNRVFLDQAGDRLFD